MRPPLFALALARSAALTGLIVLLVLLVVGVATLAGCR